VRECARLALAVAKLRSMESRKYRLVGDRGDALAAPRAVGSDLLTAEEAAELLRVARKWVYAHATELGGFRLLGDRGPWRFSRRELLERYASSPNSGAARRFPARRAARSRERTHTPSGAPILHAEPRVEAG
jgi:Helix-turn-helix domain